MQTATITDAPGTPAGTELYYLEQIYYILLLIFILLLVWFVGVKVRSMYRKIIGGDKENV